MKSEKETISLKQNHFYDLEINNPPLDRNRVKKKFK